MTDLIAKGRAESFYNQLQVKYLTLGIAANEKLLHIYERAVLVVKF